MSQSPSVATETVIPSDADLLMTRQVTLDIAEGLIALLRSPGLPKPFEVQLYELLEAVVQDASDEGMLANYYSHRRALADLNDEIFSLSEEQDESETFQNAPKLAEIVDRLADAFTLVRGSARRVLIDSAEQILVDLDNAKIEVESSELVLAIATVLSKATVMLGSRKKAEEWLTGANDAIGGASPISMLDKCEGMQIVQGLLRDISPDA